MESSCEVGLGSEFRGCSGRVVVRPPLLAAPAIEDRLPRLIAVWECGRVKEWVRPVWAIGSCLLAHPHNKRLQPTSALSRPVLAHGPRQPATPDRARS